LRQAVADYEVVEVIGTTPAGRPRFLCRPPSRLMDDEPVTVTELAVDASGWTRLIAALARYVAVGSDHLLRVIEVGPDLERPTPGVYLVTERSSPWPAGAGADGLRVARDVARVALGAHAMHETGLAHGRIDPAAVVSGDRGALLGPPPLDDPPGTVARAADGMTLPYIDPVLLAGEEPSRASDVWSLGALLHSVLSTLPLYPGLARDQPVTAVQKVMFTRPVVDQDLPAWAGDLVASCLARDPTRRPSTALDVAEAIHARTPEP